MRYSKLITRQAKIKSNECIRWFGILWIIYNQSGSHIQGWHGGNIATYGSFTTNNVEMLWRSRCFVSGVTEINNSTITGGSGGIKPLIMVIFSKWRVGVYQTMEH